MASLKPEFGYVLGVAVGSWGLHHLYLAFKVVGARKKYNVKYPDMYATEANCANETDRRTFNCIQRAHQNSLELQPIFLSLLTLSGLQYPVTAASLGALYLVGRVGYAAGYSTGNPDARVNKLTLLGYVGLFGLVGTTVTAAVNLLKSK